MIQMENYCRTVRLPLISSSWRYRSTQHKREGVTFFTVAFPSCGSPFVMLFFAILSRVSFSNEVC